MALIDNLVSYWKLDEASGNALDAHGTNELVETSGTITSVTGKILTARDFESADTEWFTIADNASLSAGNTDFSIQAWVNLESKSGFRTAIGKNNGSTALGSEYLLGHDNTLDLFTFTVYSGSASITIPATSFGAPALATWYQVIGWHDAVNDLVGIAVNAGTADTLTTAGAAPNDTATAFFMGACGSSTNLMDGIIDESAFWRRVLTADERTALYNGGAGLAYPFTGGAIVAPWAQGFSRIIGAGPMVS